MRIGILGLEQSGKKTLFQLLTGSKAGSSHGKLEFPVGVGRIPDERMDRLCQLFRPKKTSLAEIEWVLFPAPPADLKTRDKWFEEAAFLDGLCYVVREFRDPGVYHPEGSVDPARDIEALDLDFTISDLAAVEKRLERMAKDRVKRTAAERERTREVLEKLKLELDEGRPLRGIELTDGEVERLTGQRFLTRADCLIVVNVDESIAGDEEARTRLLVTIPAAGREVVCISVKIEGELAEIDDDAERAELMESMGIETSGAERLARAALKALGRIPFFTVGPNEVHAWLVREGATAVEAAGAIHTDFARCFIRAEVMSVDELIRAGSEAKLREQGKIAARGKDYVVQDGEIVHILAGT